MSSVLPVRVIELAVGRLAADLAEAEVEVEVEVERAVVGGRRGARRAGRREAALAPTSVVVQPAAVTTAFPLTLPYRVPKVMRPGSAAAARR